ncbi:MAG TPA: hypothetical protein VFD87_17250 [Phototrophicaceae bacterium]|nr:hypothetical protein [Phototrophicaceae bacterium]
MQFRLLNIRLLLNRKSSHQGTGLSGLNDFIVQAAQALGQLQRFISAYPVPAAAVFAAGNLDLFSRP